MGALFFHAYGAYVVVLRREFGWSKTMFSAAFAMARAESGILGPVQGWLTDRFGPRTLIRIGLCIFAVGFMLFSQIGSPVTFFLTFFLMALGSSLGGYLPIAVAIVAWFRRRRAFALSISSTGMPIGGLLTQLVVLALTAFGWRWTAFLSGLAILAIGLPIGRLIHHRPEARGEWPDGEPAVPSGTFVSAETGSRASGVDFTPREAMRAPALWYISLGHGAALLVVSAVSVHLVVHLTEHLGYSLQQAAAVVAMMTVLQVVAQLGGGWAGDRFNKRAIVVGCMVAHAAGLLLLASATAFPAVAAFAVLHFGSAAFGTITGISSMVVMFGMVGGPVIAGVLADRTGSYELGFQILSGLAALGSIFFVFARRPAPPNRFETPPRRADGS
jgi:sugar phosphate permease